MKKILSLAALLLLSACISGQQVGQQPRLSTNNAPMALNGDVTVVAGDTVYSIARRHNVPMSALINANGLRAPYVLQPGQIIHLPAVAGGNSDSTMASQPYDRSVVGTPESLAPLDAPVSAEPLDGGQTTATGTDRHDMVLTPLGPSTTPTAGEEIAPTSLAPSEGAGVAEAAQQATQPAVPVKPGLFDWPVNGHVTNSTGSGMDIAAPKGTPVQATAGGTVMKATTDTVVIRHPDGYESTYSHLERVLVDGDAVVGKGDAIGTVGTAGSKTPLVHFELKQGGSALDPTAWLPAK